MLDIDQNIIILVVIAIFSGGLVKGTLGVGMPMLAVPIIAFVLPPTKAMILLCFPILCSNFLQMNVQKGIGSYRFLPLTIMLILGLIIGGRLIVEIEMSTISIIIALSIILAAIINLFGIKFKNIKPNYEKPFTMILGFFSGILGGFSTFFGPPILAYLISIDLEKESFVRTISVMYFVGGIILYSSLLYHGLGTLNDLYLSALMTLPAMIGLYFGTKIRKKISNDLFRKFILTMLILVGFSLLIKNL